VTDAIDGTQMEVDYVRIYERLATSVQAKKTVSADVQVRGNNLVITSEINLKLELFTLNGSLLTVKSIPSGSYSMTVRQGIYMVRLSSNTAVTTRKIAINTDQ